MNEIEQELENIVFTVKTRGKNGRFKTAMTTDGRELLYNLHINSPVVIKYESLKWYDKLFRTAKYVEYKEDTLRAQGYFDACVELGTLVLSMTKGNK